jgi:hypothetical protein
MTASRSTLAAMIHIVLFTLFGTCLTDIRTYLANSMSMLAAKGHEVHSRFADRRTFKIQSYATRHGIHIFFLQA